MGHAARMVMGCALVLATSCAQVDGDAASVEGSLERADAALCVGPSPSVIAIDARRSLVVTEQPILARFSFERVMNHLVSQAAIPGLTATKLFQQWWDTQNTSAAAANAGEHCDDQVDASLGPVFNGFPYACRTAPAEGMQASCDPFRDPACAYIPVGLFNRFELAPEDGSNCGQYRIVFAKASGQTSNRDRNLVIFEAALPNPHPRRGLEGCRPIAQYWAQLSRVSNLQARAKLLERFYFEGMGHGVPAAIDIKHFGDNGSGAGQVRTNQFMQPSGRPSVWSLREFKIRRTCRTKGYRFRPDTSCSLSFERATNKNNPYGPLFADTSTHPLARSFQESFVNELDDLAASNVGDIHMATEDKFNSALSEASQAGETNYLASFEDSGDFADDLDDRLSALGSELEPVDVVARAQTQSCAGCHQLSNNAELGGGLVWPASLGFTHVSERDPEIVDGVTRFRISAALTSTFLPKRKQVLEDFLSRRHRGRAFGLGQASH